MHKIHLVAAARPNFMKVAPMLHRLADEAWALPLLIHTGQHYDDQMSAFFLRDLKLPKPHVHLGVGSGTHAQQTAAVMVEYEAHCLEERPDIIIVVGDVNSTMAAALTAAKLNIPVAHLEAGLRSFDRTMPEEINRIVTDRVSTLLWTPSEDADENLQREGVKAESVHRVGNIMIDTLEMLRPLIQEQAPPSGANEAVLVTLHRPANVDDPDRLEELVTALIDISRNHQVNFPVHPRTHQRLRQYGLDARLREAVGINVMEPLGYLAFMRLVFTASAVVTDSGGLQEETTYLGIPCVTLRPNTERPITITHGTNRLVEIVSLANTVDGVLAKGRPPRPVIPLWDGRTADRTVKNLRKHLGV